MPLPPSESSIPVEKMSLLDAPDGGCCGGACHKRINILRTLLDIYPQAVRQANNDGDFPLTLQIQCGRPWDRTLSLALQAFPEALHSVDTIDPVLMPLVYEKMMTECGTATVYNYLRNQFS